MSPKVFLFRFTHVTFLATASAIFAPAFSLAVMWFYRVKTDCVLLEYKEVPISQKFITSCRKILLNIKSSNVKFVVKK